MPNSVFITGPHGCGKTSLARKLATEFELKFASAGDIRGDILVERGYETMEEWNASDESDKNTCVDLRIMDICMNPEKYRIAFDTHIGNFFWYECGQPEEIVTLYLAVSPEIGARRINDHLEENPDVRLDEPRGLSLQERMERIDRKTTEFFEQVNADPNKVFKGYIPDFRLPVVFRNPHFFQHVIDTDDLTQTAVYMDARSYLLNRGFQPYTKNVLRLAK